jgi:hypothetical protein
LYLQKSLWVLHYAQTHSQIDQDLISNGSIAFLDRNPIPPESNKAALLNVFWYHDSLWRYGD